MVQEVLDPPEVFPGQALGGGHGSWGKVLTMFIRSPPPPDQPWRLVEGGHPEPLVAVGLGNRRCNAETSAGYQTSRPDLLSKSRSSHRSAPNKIFKEPRQIAEQSDFLERKAIGVEMH